MVDNQMALAISLDTLDVIAIACFILASLIPLAVGKAKSIKFRIDWLSISLAVLLIACTWVIYSLKAARADYHTWEKVLPAIELLYALALARLAIPVPIFRLRRKDILDIIFRSIQAYAVIWWLQTEFFWIRIKLTLALIQAPYKPYEPDTPIWYYAREHKAEALVFILGAFVIALLPILTRKLNPVRIYLDRWTWIAFAIAGLAQSTMSLWGQGLIAFFWFDADMKLLFLAQQVAWTFYGLLLARFKLSDVSDRSRLRNVGEYAARAVLFISLMFLLQNALDSAAWFLGQLLIFLPYYFSP